MSYIRIDFYCVDTASQKWYWDYRILKSQLLWGHGRQKWLHGATGKGPASQVSDCGKSRCLWWYFPGIEKMKFNIELVKAKSFWLAQEQKKKKLSNLRNLFPSPFCSSENFLFFSKTFPFSAQVGPEEQSYGFIWSWFMLSKDRHQRHLFLCTKSAGDRSLARQELSWQDQFLAFWDVKRWFWLICFVWAARHPEILAKCSYSLLHGSISKWIKEDISRRADGEKVPSEERRQ